MIALLLLLLLQATTGQASISGSVVDVGTVYLQPLLDARVELIRPSGSPLVVRTDPNGRFAFSGLPAGRYRVSVTRDGYQRKSAAIELANGQQRTDVVVALDLAPTLFGHVLDTYNIPMANVLVEAIKVVYGPRGDRSVLSVESALSDDRGEYHLYWLDPGEYYIRASSLELKPGESIPGNSRSDAPGPRYAQTYFPGFRDPKDATLIRLRVGSNFSAFDFKLQPVIPVSISGHIYIEATRESAGGAVIIANYAGAVASDQKFQTRSTPSGRDMGEFGMGGMTQGTYIVSAQYSTGGQQLVAHRKATIKVAERSFMLYLTPGSTANGRIAATSEPALDLRSVRIALESVDSDLPSPASATVSANGQFSLARVEPGEYILRTVNLPGDVYVKSIRSGDVDIQAKPLVIRYASPEPIRVDLGIDGGRMDGVVVDSANHPFAGATVAVVPDANRRNSPDQYRVTESEADGHFTLRGIPPGDYKLFAWQNIEPNAYLNDVYMTGFEPLGVPATIAPNSAGITSVRLIPMD
jgi:hypothetical protein